MYDTIVSQKTLNDTSITGLSVVQKVGLRLYVGKVYSSTLGKGNECDITDVSASLPVRHF